jgi:hypothetical protein
MNIEKADWIKKLKVNDKVAEQTRSGFSMNTSYKICTVSKITPTGRIYLKESRSKYYANEHGIGHSYDLIVPVTPEVMQAIERSDYHYELDFRSIEKDLSLEQMRIVIEWQRVIKNKREKGEEESKRRCTEMKEQFRKEREENDIKKTIENRGVNS